MVDSKEKNNNKKTKQKALYFDPFRWNYFNSINRVKIQKLAYIFV